MEQNDYDFIGEAMIGVKIGLLTIALLMNAAVICVAWVGAIRVRMNIEGASWIPNETLAFYLFLISLIIWAAFATVVIYRRKKRPKNQLPSFSVFEGR